MSTVTLTTRRVLRKGDLREANERLILNLVRQTPDISRSDLVRITGFSASSVSLIINRLVKRGWVREERVGGTPQTGRPPVALRLNAECMLAVGVEISRTRSRVVVADLHGNILRQRSIAWHDSAPLYLGRLRSALEAELQLCGKTTVLGIGVSLPGTVDRNTGLVIAAEDLGWFGVDLRGELARGTDLPFYFDNNAKLAATAERWYLRAGSREPRDYVFITAQGGLGTGVVIEGRILHGADGEASEFGHTMLYADGRKCVCGNTGCWEEYASDRALLRIYNDIAGRRNGSQDVTVEEIIKKGRDGDKVALRALEEVAQNLALGFVNLIWALNPETIIVGDHLAEGWPLLENAVWNGLRKRLPQRYLTRIRIVPEQHPGSSILLGAVACVLSHFFTTFSHQQPSAERNGVTIVSAQ